MCDRGAKGTRGWPPDWFARRRGAADTARAAPPSYGFGRAQGHRRPIARGGHHGQATERGARAVVDGDRRLTPLPDAGGEIGHLRGIAFVGPYPRTRRTQPPLHAQPPEILTQRAHALRENRPPLAARRLAAHGAIRQIADGSIGEAERPRQIVLPNGGRLPGVQ